MGCGDSNVRVRVAGRAVDMGWERNGVRRIDGGRMGRSEVGAPPPCQTHAGTHTAHALLPGYPSPLRNPSRPPHLDDGVVVRQRVKVVVEHGLKWVGGWVGG